MGEAPRNGSAENSAQFGPTTRRRLLAGGAAVGVAGLAGCLGGRDGPVPAPEVTSDRIEDWRRTDASEGTASEQSYGPVTVRALERTRIFEYAPVADALAEIVDADGSPVVFFATRVDLRPAIDRLPGEVGRDRVMSEVETAAVDAFRTRLRNAGIEDVQVADEGITTVRSGHTATAWRLTGAYAIDGAIPLPNGTTAEIDRRLEIGARLGVWHDGTDVIVSGGAYPTERLTAVLDESLPDAVDAETVVRRVADAETAEALATDPAEFDIEVSQLLISVA
ncbi:MULTISPECIES: hypothetical protein [unclassified Halorubrum]|uniref:hypothetical protein n=1 Tax=unclassified Halorubrum TaxID=2642239 RepID=UPI0010F491B1|nr:MULTISPECIES: hypothetical protein [unclassified Halorubrum]TKX43381.1 hypothetical protein EXE50_10985 [Halorubrum sp. ARQ200]TKX49791.1 hypothetical protein EXE49_09715 [Halorubrum sp. ASP121]